MLLSPTEFPDPIGSQFLAKLKEPRDREGRSLRLSVFGSLRLGVKLRDLDFAQSREETKGVRREVSRSYAPVAFCHSTSNNGTGCSRYSRLIPIRRRCIATAVDSAFEASFGVTVGAPNSAINPSPRYLSSVPPCAKMMSVIAEK